MSAATATTTPANPLDVSATKLYEQVKYQLDDEVSYATALREHRKTMTTLLVLAVGIGVFRFDLFRSADQVLVVPTWSATVIRVLFSAALVVLLYGTYQLYTERSLFRELTRARGARGAGGALSILYLNQAVIDDARIKPPHEVEWLKTDALRLAYLRLKKANKFVRRRLAIGTMALFIGSILVLIGFCFYTLTVDLTKTGNGDSHDGLHTRDTARGDCTRPCPRQERECDRRVHLPNPRGDQGARGFGSRVPHRAP